VDRLEAARELLKRKEAYDTLTGYGEWMKPTNQLDYQFSPAKHHNVLIHALERLERGDIRKLMVMMPPGAAKSTYASARFPNWYLGRHPEHNILCASNTESLAENFNRRRRTACLSKEWQLLFNTSLDKDQQNVGKFATQEGGFCQAAGVGSAIVGVRSNINILDDPILNFEQSMSSTQMDKQWEWYQADFRSRLVPDGKELIVTTRWSKGDICGRILDLVQRGEEPPWEIIRIPMEADSPDDPVGRDMGDRLWPEWFTEEMVQVNKRDTQRWMGMYQQIPMDESGVWVGQENILIVGESEDASPSLPANLTYVVGVDIALTVGGGDYTVFAVCGIDDERNLYVVDIIRQQVDVDKTCDTFFALMDMYPEIMAFYIDDDNASKMLQRLMIEKCKSRNKSVPMQVMPLRGQNKEVRAAPLRGLFMQKRIQIMKTPKWTNTLIAELMDFPPTSKSDHDDQVDALSLVGRQYSSIPTPKKDITANVDLDFFVKEQGGVQMTTIGLDSLYKDQKRGKLSIVRRRI
jgi:predicted phage terminase large subunit-like protein